MEAVPLRECQASSMNRFMPMIIELNVQLIKYFY